MKTQTKTNNHLLWAVGLISLFTACKKEISSDNSSTTSSTSSTIAVAAVNPASSTVISAAVADSVYLLQTCERGGHRDSIASSDLLPVITSYLSTNYSGYTFIKAFSIKNSSGGVTGYIVAVFYNSKPVGVQFDANGTFIKVLEQRERADLDGRGWHERGRFEERGGFQKDTIALAALPVAITSWFSTNNASDTLVKAFRNHDSSIIVISKNNGVYASLFNSTGTFISRILLPSKGGKCASIEQNALPAAALAYLTTTYPNYVFKKAFSTGNGTITGYIVLIDANNTKYAVEFDAAGSFVRVKTVH